MSLIAVTESELSIGTPVPWDIRDPDGRILLERGALIRNETALRELMASEPCRAMPWGASVPPEVDSGNAAGRVPEPVIPDSPEHAFGFHDMRLRVGDRIQLQPPATVGQDRHVVRLIGYLDNCSLLVTTPKQNGLRVPLRENDKLVARVFTSQKAFGFSTTIERVCKIPYEYMHLAFPKQIQGSMVRKAPRVRTRIIASIAMPDVSGDSEKQSGVIVNLSADGALVKARRALREKGETIRLSFRVSLHNIDALLNVQAVVRNIFSDEAAAGDAAGMINHGVQFENIPANDSMILQSLIYQQMIEHPHTIA